MTPLARAREQIARHLAAFVTANPGKELPQLNYEKGWFVFRYRMTGGIPSRVRGADLDKMTRRLLDRALATTGDDDG